MHIFNLKQRVGWGNEIHIRTEYADYAGSGRCCLNKSPFGIIHKKPAMSELLKNVRVSGHCSTPYVRNGDILVYETDDGEEIKLRFRQVEYKRDPHDMFFGRLVLIVDCPTIFQRIKKTLGF